MYYALALFLIFLAILFHEMGHLIAMRMSGIWVSELGFGLPYGPSIGAKWTSKTDPKKSFRISLYPLLIGAFVRPEETVARSSYKTHSFVCGAGIIGNLVHIALSLVIIGIIIPEGRVFVSPLGTLSPPYMIFGGFAAAIGVVLLAKPITQYLFPPLSLAVLVYIAMLLSNLTATQFVENSGGMLVLGQMAESYSKGPIDALFFGMLISYLLALTNLLPLYPLDGGQTIKHFVDKYLPWATKSFDRVGLYIVYVLIAVAMLGDLRLVFRWIF